MPRKVRPLRAVGGTGCPDRTRNRSRHAAPRRVEPDRSGEDRFVFCRARVVGKHDRRLRVNRAVEGRGGERQAQTVGDTRTRRDEEPALSADKHTPAGQIVAFFRGSTLHAETHFHAKHGMNYRLF